MYESIVECLATMWILGQLKFKLSNLLFIVVSEVDFFKFWLKVVCRKILTKVYPNRCALLDIADAGL